MSPRIDLNCDMGESFGAWTMGNDAAVLPFVTSVNIACGFHAGDPSIMRQTVADAIRHGVAPGAHPGLPDLAGFGRRPMDISAQAVYDLVVVQAGALAGVAATQGARLHHVKAHGALYNMAAINRDIAHAIARAVYDLDPSLTLYALAGSVQAAVAQEVGLKVAHEVFADRTYQDDGTLTSRKQGNAMITDVDAAIAQALQMVTDGSVTSATGKTVSVQADTLCLHGDQPGAAEFARAIRSAFQKNGVQIQAFS